MTITLTRDPDQRDLTYESPERSQADLTEQVVVSRTVIGDA